MCSAASRAAPEPARRDAGTSRRVRMPSLSATRSGATLHLTIRCGRVRRPAGAARAGGAHVGSDHSRARGGSLGLTVSETGPAMTPAVPRWAPVSATWPTGSRPSTASSKSGPPQAGHHRQGRTCRFRPSPPRRRRADIAGPTSQPLAWLISPQRAQDPARAANAQVGEENQLGGGTGVNVAWRVCP
jgi:hypothetical protein